MSEWHNIVKKSTNIKHNELKDLYETKINDNMEIFTHNLQADTRKQRKIK